MTVAPFAVAATHVARAAVAEGCTAQGPNGVIAAGTVTDGNPTAPPSGAQPTPTCTFTEPAGSVGGGWGGGDSVKWSVTTTINAATDNAGQACGFTADPPPAPGKPQTYTASGTGPGSGGLGCLKPGAVVTATAA
jgi:hypothetical protein